MNAEADGGKRRWTAAAASAVVVLLLFIVLMRITHLPSVATFTSPAAARKSNPAVQFAPPAQAKEEVIMHDQRPLFLPTDKNAAFPKVSRPEAGRNLLDREASRLTFDLGQLNLSLPAPVRVPETVIDATLVDAEPAPLHGFGVVQKEVAAEDARGGFVEIMEIRTNRRLLAEPLPIEARPKAGNAWRPVEFFATVNPAGLAAPLVVTERSDVEEVDNFFRNYLAQKFHVGERLAPGFYRIVVGP